MRAMKDSGIEWIGKIPTDWEIVRLKYVAQPYTGNSIKDAEKAQYEDISQIPYIATKDIDATFQTVDYDNGMYIQPDDLSFKRVPKDSTLLCIEGGSAGKKIAFVDRTVCFVNKLCCFHSDNMCNNKFLFYYLMSPSFSADFTSNISGLIGGVSVNKLATFSVPIPCMNEQQRIADFLDEKCADIDTAISEAKASIEDYKLLKQSIITRAVTKGLNANAEMKDSGIEWIGKVPKTWNLRKLKKVAKTRNEKYNDSCTQDIYIGLENIESYSGHYLTTNNIYDKTQALSCKSDDVIFGKLRPYLAKVYLLPKDALCSSEFAVFYDFCGIAKYLKYLFLSQRFIEIVNASTYGTKMPRANIDFIKNIDICLPSLSEQHSIAEYLDDKCSAIDALISEKEQIISELEAYKKSLIFEYVTGKKEVA